MRGEATPCFSRHIILPLARTPDPPASHRKWGTMLEFYFSYRGVLKRLRSGALGAEMDRIADDLHTQGYKPASARLYLSRIARFSHFADKRRGSGPISATIVDRYLRTLGADSPRIAAVTALQHARRVAPARFAPVVATVVDDPDAALLASFSEYLSKVRGLEPKSREGSLLGARRFLQWFRIRHPDLDLGTLTAHHVIAAVEHQLSLSAASSTRTAATSHIRTFLRFLHWSDHHPRDLAPIVPRTPHWRLAHLPPRLSWTEVRRAIDAIDRATPIDVRDRAVLLLLATTGIRNGELRALQLQDIDWRAGEVFIRHTKGKRDRVAPLLKETGAALADYILRARPKVDNTHLFLTFTAPVGSIKYAASVSRIVRKRLQCSGIELGRVAGAHLLRHSLATKLVEQRRPINEIADLLGHRSINTTALYVKVATSQLADVALPFPGGAA
jgi:integrase/recombinase XerD